MNDTTAAGGEETTRGGCSTGRVRGEEERGPAGT
jgi:hypothetical protein